MNMNIFILVFGSVFAEPLIRGVHFNATVFKEETQAGPFAVSAYDRLMGMMRGTSCGKAFFHDFRSIETTSGFQYIHLDFITPSVFYAKRNKLRNCYERLGICWNKMTLNYPVGASVVHVVLGYLIAPGFIIFWIYRNDGRKKYYFIALVPVALASPSMNIVVVGWKYAFGWCQVSTMISQNCNSYNC
ncbi:Oidioi.mRNA.OKI2018_I69.chr1.g1867.t1.cds [Oikopleura dioica]|uniref:Oidioi.mRNA.OKI2018_I69.chr1.g1867.t1.cds n=1 Tax=Oikopleura dioica TaxID=34765 RepID=A0ABN7SYE0_OIKDI|nr:Oidioi.mRNA.OKI2018_I69.chr1.g1867.t1.cds [Oikopleura dioica]